MRGEMFLSVIFFWESIYFCGLFARLDHQMKSINKYCLHLMVGLDGFSILQLKGQSYCLYVYITHKNLFGILLI